VAIAVTGLTLLGACSGGSGGGDAQRDARCEDLRAAFSNPVGAVDPAALTDLAATTERFRRAAEAAPERLRADVTLIADAYEQFGRALGEIGYDPTNPAAITELDEDQLNRFEQAATDFNDQELRDAADRVEAVVAEQCP